MERNRWVLSALVIALAASGCEGQGRRQFMSLATAGTGGVYYPLGGAIASRLSVRDSLRQYTAEVSGGSVENVNRLRENQIDLAFALGITIFEAHHGGLDYAEPFQDLVVLAPLYANLTHVMVPGDSPVRSLADLRGLRVSVGPPGSGTEQISRQLLEAVGLDYGEVDPRYLSFSESSSAIRDGAIDAAILSVGYPASAVLEATTTGDARLVGVSAEELATLRSRYPYYSPGVLPAGSYPGVEGDIPTVGVMNWIVGRAGLADDVVALLLDILENERAQLNQVHEMAAQIDLATLTDAPIPLHPVTRAWLEARN